MTYLEIDPAIRHQLRTLYHHHAPRSVPALTSPPRTAMALAHLHQLWEATRSASETARQAQLEELETFVDETHGRDSDLAARLGAGA